MKVLVAESPFEIVERSIPEPICGTFDCVVRVLAGAIGGMQYKLMTSPDSPYPFVPGYETVGQVVECGAGVRNFAVGDLVLGPILWRMHSDETYGLRYGGFSEYAMIGDWAAREAAGNTPDWFASSVRNVHRRIEPEENPVNAAAYHTLLEALNCCDDFGVRRGSRALVLGAGAAGLSFVCLARALGAEWITLCSRSELRLELGKKIGADEAILAPDGLSDTAFDGPKYDVLIDAAGVDGFVPRALSMAAECARVCLYGTCDSKSTSIDWRKAPRSWSVVKMLPLASRTPEQTAQSFDLLRVLRNRGLIDPSRLVDVCVPPRDLGVALSQLKQKRASKVVLDLREW